MWILLFLPACILLDQFTKILALNKLSETSSVPVISSIFHLTLVKNTGVAFGFLKNSSHIVFIFVSLSICVLFWIFIRMKNLYDKIALSLIISGAIGNWIDRVRLGYVVDFLDFRVWPVFNVADSCVTIGVGLLVLQLLRKKEV